MQSVTASGHKAQQSHDGRCFVKQKQNFFTGVDEMNMGEVPEVETQLEFVLLWVWLVHYNST